MHLGKNTHICVGFMGVPGLMFTKLTAGIEQALQQYIEIATARSRDVAIVTDLWHVSQKIDTPRFHSVCWQWHSTVDGDIATPIVALISTMMPLSDKNFVNFGPITSEISW